MKRTLYPLLAFIAAFVLGACACGGELNATGSIRFSNDISPSQITAQQDNYNPTGLKGASVLRLNSDASRDITGLAGGYDGRVLLLHNVGSNPIVLKDASGSSSAANQFALTGDITLNTDSVAILQYDGTSSKWRLAGTSGSGGVAHSSLTGLTSGDDHTQYTLLAGRSGGQTLNGSTAASEHLVLQSTAHATEGEVQIKNSDAFRVYDADDTDSIYFSEDGVGNFNITNSTNDLEIHGANNIALYPAGADVQIFGTGGSNFIKLTHDNTDGTITTSAGDLKVTSATGSVVTQTAAIATNATDGFLYIPSSAGKPTGTPTTQTGTVPLHADSTNNVVWAYQNSLWQQIGGAANILPANCQRTFGESFTTSTLAVTSDTAYWIYLGYTLKPITIKYVEVRVTVAGSGAQTAEVALASSTNPPNKGNQTLTKLTADGTLDSLTGTGVIRNTSSLDYACAAGVHLWAGIRTAMATTQPTFRSIGEDYGAGNFLQTAGAGALTGAGPWTGTVNSSAGTATVALRVTMD